MLRLTRSARSSYHNLFVGTVALLLALLTVLPWFLANGGRIVGLDVRGRDSAGELWIVFIASWSLKLHRTLNPSAMKSVTTAAQPALKASITTTALPPAPVFVLRGQRISCHLTCELSKPSPQRPQHFRIR